jgi:hypothetical protein
MYDTLVFLHVLSAFIAFVSVMMFSAYAFGAPVGRGDFVVADWTWNVSGAGLLVFGVWLALYVDGYQLWDGWILGSLLLLIAASAFGARARTVVMVELGDGARAGPTARQVTLWHWLRTLSVVAILVLMIWKPGA